MLSGRAEGKNLVRIGPTLFDCRHGHPNGAPVKVYLRPEDVLARTAAGNGPDPARPPGGAAAADSNSVFATEIRGSRFGAGDRNVFVADIEKIEFLGSYCLVRMASPAIGEHRLTVYLSLNYLAEQQLQPGSQVPVKVLPERMRVFADMPGAA